MPSHRRREEASSSAHPNGASPADRRPHQGQAAAVRQKQRKKETNPPPKWWKLWSFVVLLGLDAVVALVLETPLISGIYRREELSEHHYSLHSALWDLATLAVPRIFFALVTLLYAYHRARRQVVDGDVDEENDSPFSLYHENGDRKSNSELEAEALEEPFLPQLRRYVRRLSFLNEMAVLVTGVLLALKAMARLNVEIGVWDDARPQHPLFWMALAATALLSFVESLYMDSMEGLVGRLGRERRRNAAAGVAPTWAERISDSLTQPLLSSRENVMQATDASSDAAVEEGRPPVVNENARGDSGIGPDALYTASAKDFFRICEPDKYLILLACVFLLFGGAFQVFIPKFTGAILDALVDTDSPSDSPNSLFLSRWFTTDDASTVGGSITHIPGFIKNIELLLIVSILGGLCAGVRGAIFTMVGARVNTRLRIMLMDSLLSQEIGFYDTTRTGDITSRLSSDTTIVGSSITSQVSIFLRSTVRVIGVLIFMFFISWQLSLLAFLTIPAVSILSKWYGRYLRRLSKLQQKKLADGNSVSESTISSMATVRAFGAETVELDDFEDCMANYLRLNAKAAIATMGYSTLVGALPQLVNALVLFYGGLLVQTDGPGHITGGQLVSFILYLSALSESFNSLGGIYASLVRLAGAADKVLELLNRESRVSEPSNVDEGKVELAMQKRKHHLLSVESNRVVRQRALGLYPESCSGDITFSNVEFRYPARPQRVVLDCMNLTIPSGSIVALVGVSGGGKSSIVKLIQQLYEPLQGTVCIDGVPVKELSADWLCRNVSVVSQEPALFARSVRRNIMYGLEGTDAEPSQEEIEEAARLANAADFIESLPKGYDTEVGERGIQLSGGQKQRVAIARALVRKPKILLLDEATSALDSESEHVVQEAIDEMINGQRSLDGDPSRSMTVVIVAHRLSTIRNADCIYVVKEGRVAEQGSHEELIDIQNGVYASLVDRQLGQVSRVSSRADLNDTARNNPKRAP